MVTVLCLRYGMEQGSRKRPYCRLRRAFLNPGIEDADSTSHEEFRRAYA